MFACLYLLVIICVMFSKLVRLNEKKSQQVRKVLADAELLKQAKGILRAHQHHRDVCKKKLLVTHYRVLLQDLGAGDQLRHQVEGRTVATKRPGLVSAYWSRHVDLTPGLYSTHSHTHTLSHTQGEGEGGRKCSAVLRVGASASTLRSRCALFPLPLPFSYPFPPHSH